MWAKCFTPVLVRGGGQAESIPVVGVHVRRY